MVIQFNTKATKNLKYKIQNKKKIHGYVQVGGKDAKEEGEGEEEDEKI